MTHFCWWQRQHQMLRAVKGWRRDSLLFGEASEVLPVARKVFKLEGVDGDEHQHGVGHHQPPEELQQTPPQRVVHLRDTAHSRHKPSPQVGSSKVQIRSYSFINDKNATVLLFTKVHFTFLSIRRIQIRGATHKFKHLSI